MAIGENPQAVTAGARRVRAVGRRARRTSRWEEGAFSATVGDPAVKVNHAWFRGGWLDPLTMAWKDVAAGRLLSTGRR